MIDPRLQKFPGFRAAMSVLMLLSLVQALAILGQSYGLTESLVRLWQLRSLDALPVPVAVFAGSFVLRQLCEVGKQRVGTRFADRTIAELRPRVQRAIFAAGPSSMARRGTGATVTMLIDGLDQTKTYIQTVLPKMMDMSIIPVAVLIVVWSQSWLSGLVLLCALPLLIFFMAILGIAARDKSDRQYEQFRMLNNRFVDTILGLPTLKMLGVSQAYEREVYTVSERFRRRTMAVIGVAMTSTFALDFFTTLSIAIVAVFLGNNLIGGAIALFPALFALILAPEYFLPIRQFGNDYHATLNGKNALNDIMTLLETPAPPRDETTAWDGWTPSSTLALHDVTFSYPRAEEPTAPAKPSTPDRGRRRRGERATTASAETTVSLGPVVLDGLDLELHGHERVAVIGRSGSGKSTLVNLLAGFHLPQYGTITLDGTPLPHLNVAAWQRHISYIPQTPYIFHGSIADNIRFYRPDAPDDEVRVAANRAGLADWLATLPHGLDTAIGEGNRGISGGQAQRIALARVMLDGSREILLFDEPTAHLDIETEYELKRTLLPVMRDHLVILATHRLHWLDDVDRVVVLDHGRIVEQGDPCELKGRGGALDELIGEMGGNQIDGYHTND
ncbi:MAG: thiol reductant ABC exporter subunit CydD [Bifidobacterium mongoliense]|uniref:thiol reductant ABC exporter subunit CydD n=1 Tax=Bifidobacterium mongoliense TaxID=518643 RepID=UPI002F350A58